MTARARRGCRRRCSDGAIQTEPFFPLSFLSFSTSSQGEKGQVQRRLWRRFTFSFPFWIVTQEGGFLLFLFLFRLIGGKRFWQSADKDSDRCKIGIKNYFLYLFCV
ncbi:hypothetical protein V8G54_003357 [Vigna mungo]|uniref:Uncharacterized protein n=1 Tax=Vigna mungo TaxID=3915 RepID=A0AAQ3SCX0_VIGMU